jgi:hypothetical protein
MFIDIPPNRVIVSVDREEHAREYGYLALDRRREFLLVSSSLRRIADAIDEFAHEEVGRTSMYDCAACKSRRGYVGSFRFERYPRDELPSHVQAHRARYKHVIICASRESAWHLAEDAKVGDVAAQSD